MNNLYFYALCAFALAVLIGCGSLLPAKRVSTAVYTSTTMPDDLNEPEIADAAESALAVLTFSLKLNQKVYEDSDWGEPPQFAIWLEDTARSKIQTLWVTYRTGTGNWGGKMDCPVSPPYWVSRYNKETGNIGAPTPNNPVVEAVTGATPKKVFTVHAEVTLGSRWRYFIEVNISVMGLPKISFQSSPESGS